MRQVYIGGIKSEVEKIRQFKKGVKIFCHTFSAPLYTPRIKICHIFGLLKKETKDLDS